MGRDDGSELVIARQRQQGVEHDVVEYLTTPPTREQLEQILDLLSEAPAELVRKDKRFKELGLDAGDYTTASAVVDLLVEHPELMQRPVLVRGDRAIIARPADKIAELLDS